MARSFCKGSDSLTCRHEVAERSCRFANSNAPVCPLVQAVMSLLKVVQDVTMFFDAFSLTSQLRNRRFKPP